MGEKPNVIVPVVHLNGTSAEALLELRQKAYSALGDAIDALKQMAPNARDYYPDPPRFMKAVLQHDRRLTALTEIMEEIQIECEAILGYTQS